MPTKVLMPALSPTMTEGTLSKWLVQEGDEVASGDPIAEIETDKATMEVEAVEEGTIGRILVEAGTEGVKVNEVIALLLGEDEDASALDEADIAPPVAPPDAGGGEEKKPEAKAEPGPKPAEKPAAETKAPAKAGASYAEKGGEAGPAPRDAEGNRVFSSPLARRIAKLEGIDLSAVTGTGPHGRVVKADVEKALAAGGAKAAPAAAPAAAEAAAPPPAAVGLTQDMLANLPPYDEVEASSMRKVVAKRLTESKQTVPHFYLTVDCEIDALLKARKELNARAPEGEGAYKLSVNDFVIKACAAALKRVPAANAMWAGDRMYRFKNADISVAVAIEGGLITPIVKAAEGKGLVEISNEMRDLAKRAREGKLKPEEYQGGTFSISNLGMYGIKHFDAVINPPQGCILAVGAGEERPVVKNGAIAVATVMTVTLSVDHRVVDGAVGAEFLAALKPMLEDPVTMLL